MAYEAHTSATVVRGLRVVCDTRRSAGLGFDAIGGVGASRPPWLRVGRDVEVALSPGSGLAAVDIGMTAAEQVGEEVGEDSRQQASFAGGGEAGFADQIGKACDQRVHDAPP